MRNSSNNIKLAIIKNIKNIPGNKYNKIINNQHNNHNIIIEFRFPKVKINENKVFGTNVKHIYFK